MAPTKEQIKTVLAELDADPNISDDMFWVMAHQRLKLPYGELFPLMRKDAEYFELDFSGQTVESQFNSRKRK